MTITTTEGTTVLRCRISMEVFATDSILGVEISSHPPRLMFRWGILPDRRFCSRNFEASRALFQETGSNSRVLSQPEVSFLDFLNYPAEKSDCGKSDIGRCLWRSPENIPEGLSPTWATQSQGVKPTVQLDSKNEIFSSPVYSSS